MSEEFTSAKLTIGQINAMVKKIGGYEGALRFLRGEITVSSTPKWKEENGIFRFKITTDGAMGPEWVMRLKSSNIIVSESIIKMLCSANFKSTLGETTEIVVCTNTHICENVLSKMKKAEISYFNLDIELACLIRFLFSDHILKDMELWEIYVHIKEQFDEESDWTGFRIRRDHPNHLETGIVKPDGVWGAAYGFAFGVKSN